MCRNRKTNLLPLNIIFLVFSSLEIRRLIQTKVYCMFFCFIWKETTHKPGTAKNFLFGVCIIGSTFLDVFFFIPNVTTGRFFIEVYCYPRFFTTGCCCFFINKCFERTPYFTFYLHNNSTILIQKFQTEALVYYAC